MQPRQQTRQQEHAPQTHQAQQQAQPQSQQADPSALLEQILQATHTPRYKVVDDALRSRIDKVEELLPAFMSGQAERLCKRAMLTFARNPNLEACTPGSFVRTVLEAAELGLSIDGRLAHAVPRNISYKDEKGIWQKRKEACLNVDYKGLVAVAKRLKQIRDISADVICQNDEYEAYKKNGECFLYHKKPLSGRGNALGAYAIIVLPDGSWRFEEMNREELDKIKAVSPAKNDGPYVAWPHEMDKKNVVRRTLKLYCDDPGLIRLFEIEDRDFDPNEAPELEPGATKVSPVDPLLGDVIPMGNGQENGHQEENHDADSRPSSSSSSPGVEVDP